MPLALTFLAGQFRMALVTKEANLRGAQQVQGAVGAGPIHDAALERKRAFLGEDAVERLAEILAAIERWRDDGY